MANWTSLREANKARDIEWTGGTLHDYTWRGCELGGEVGEVITEVLHADLWDRRTSHLLPELSDVVICVDLTGMTLGLEPLPIHSAGSLGVAGLDRDALRLGHHVLLMQNAIKKLERERRGWPGSRAERVDVHNGLRYIMGRIGLYASYCKVDLKQGVMDTFNATSRKVGLTTFLTDLV